MSKRFRIYLFGCSILIFILTITVLTDCKNAVYIESPEIKEMIEHDEIKASEPEIFNGPGNLNTNLTTTEIYENFLNGKLTAKRDKQQVYINELFWDNDIEYCFFDIDSDNSAELHIRDNAAYYIVKVLDETPRIIFEGWWCYEPIVTDKLCGILRYMHGYGSEEIEFIKINADGGMESNGSFYWSDKNKNAKIDEDDFFLGHGDPDMQQYIQYKEEHTAEPPENELEWSGKRLNDFTTWQEAYTDFVKKIHITLSTLEDRFEYSLIYVDADDIPELYIYTGAMATGEIIVSFCDGNIGTLNRERTGMKYLEHKGLLYNMNGAMGFYPCNIYILENGEFSEIGTGWYSEYGDEQGNIYTDYYWEDSAVTENEYEASINELIDTSKCLEPSSLYSKDEILEILEAASEAP